MFASKRTSQKAAEVGKNVDKSEETLRKKARFFVFRRRKMFLTLYTKEKNNWFFFK